MATREFIGRAQARPQIDTITLGGTWASTETARITVGSSKFVEFECGGSETPSTVAAGLQALAAASQDPEFTEITWTVNAAVITATSQDGLPVTIAVSEASTSGTIVLASVQAATGPNHWDNAANWSGGAVPVNTDSVFLTLDLDILYGLPSGLTLAEFQQMAGRIGLPDNNSAGYIEYRATRLEITCTDVQFTGAISRCRLDLESSAAVVLCNARTREPLDLLLNSASSSVNVLSGEVVIAGDPSETSVVGTVRCGANGSVVCGEQCTVTTVSSAGDCEISGAVTTLTVEASRTRLLGTSAVTTANVNGGTLQYDGTGTITTCNLHSVLDCSQDIRSKTITNLNMYRGATIERPYDNLTVTNTVYGATVDRIMCL